MRHNKELEEVTDSLFFPRLENRSSNMNAHKVGAILTEDGTLMLHDLPFHAGDVVEVIILKAKTTQPTNTLPNQQETNLYPLRGKVVRYDDPTQPVALEDWEVLQ